MTPRFSQAQTLFWIKAPNFFIDNADILNIGNLIPCQNPSNTTNINFTSKLWSLNIAESGNITYHAFSKFAVGLITT